MEASSVLSEYLSAFATGHEGAIFLTYYAVAPDKSMKSTSFTRGEFLQLALKAAHVLSLQGIASGECHTHFFSKNCVGDLAFRLASVILGTTPVTINWQADTPDRVLYKVRLTESRLVIIDEGTPQDVVDMLITEEGPGGAPAIFNVANLESQPPLAGGVPTASPATSASSRIIIFTSGTTGSPKGVRLSYTSYRCNRATFESFLDAGDGQQLTAVVVNPMHHTNSTSITDWALRKPRAHLHLLERYTTQYWAVLAAAGTPLEVGGGGLTDATLLAAIRQRDSAATVVVAPLVSRHFDFLESLASGGGGGTLPLARETLMEALRCTNLLLGSAPVGPTTVARLQKYAGRLPIVRFGSTETCLQVMGTPPSLTEVARLAAFEAGWKHAFNGQQQVGYYIGRPHPPYTECRVVRSASPDAAVAEDDGFVDCAEGEPGQLITRGENVMSGYVGDELATASALRPGGWYTNLGDVCFRLVSPLDGAYDYYWQSRDSALLIRGGANYAYEQINVELQAFAVGRFGVAAEEVEIAVVGLRLDSEHEDACCVTIELSGAAAAPAKVAEIEGHFVTAAKGAVSKGARPDHVRIAPLPRNFKGAIKLPELKHEWKALLGCSA
jgi:acyl-CoA synthetase (AMP-forming)/AMP-acid ligase II